ncbi:MAG: lysophospholipase [Planctomycetes bacterium SCN 63-9]|nr:MAG: lysophospholipase [Planctomycetes bacterium SCN 63-9]
MVSSRCHGFGIRGLLMSLGVFVFTSYSAASETQSLRVVALGDSITKGVREGVRPEETFEVQAERALKAEGLNIEFVNVGIGGERTDQARKRLESVLALRPRIVTIMYGTNDSYVDQGATASRISVQEYRDNLKAIVEELLRNGVEPILMTEPRWAAVGPKNGLGENPNVRLIPFMEACRAVARECRVPLVDHFARWTEAEARGQTIGEWTTDGCHPNPRGHREIADTLRPALLEAVRPPAPAVPFITKLDTVLEHDDGKFLWYHPRAVAIPKADANADPDILITLQKHLKTSDHYSGLSDLRSGDLGKSWTGPRAVAELDWVREEGGVDVAVADVTPMFHRQSGKVLAVGAQVRYSRKGEQLEDRPRANQTAYAVYDPKTGRWTKWRRIEMPPGDSFNMARSACAQFVIEDDGSVLLPFYIGRSAEVPFSATVVRCSFDGETLTYREHGDVLSLQVERGLYEPSLVRHGGRYFLTIRNDLKGYVTTGTDGLHYRPVKPWMFDDGADLGSYNTQQHWLSHGDGLFLVYTRRGAKNDHIIRHRAPLFIARVDPDHLQIIRATEQVLIPERGAEMGNFGAGVINDRESWVTVSEGMWDDASRRKGAKGALFVARVLWQDSVPEVALPKTRAALESNQPVRIVCFGDSVTGVYYHTGSRRAYTDMLGIALRRIDPHADPTMINAGISGNTTRDALARIDRDVLERKPTLVTVMFGLNDMARLPLDEYRKNLGEIAAKCREAGAEVLFCTPNNVITTTGRPSERLVAYCDAMREEGRRLNVPVCDVYAELDALRSRDAKAWRLLMSDEIHPNMDGHKRMAEVIARAIGGRSIDLSDVPPPEPWLPRTMDRAAHGQPIRILAMSPFDEWIGSAIEQAAPGVRVEVTRWPTAGKTLKALEQNAKERVRPMAPDLVILAVPRVASSETFESFVHDYAWIMNNSLNFGSGGWDCVVVHPSVISPDPDPASGRDALIRSLVKAQDLPLIDRSRGEMHSATDLLNGWVRRQPWPRK